MSGLTDRLERDLREIAAGADPSPSAWNAIMAQLGDVGESEVALVSAPATERWKRPVRIAVAAAALVVITASAAAIFTADRDTTSDPSAPSTTINVGPTLPPTVPPFVGIWVSTDTDGSSQTMQIVTSGDDDYEFFYRDAFATACSGAPATMIGIGRLETDERLVFAQPELTCDDGTTPGIGPPPQPELANFILELTTTDEFVDPFGIVWRRADPNDETVAGSGDAVAPFASATSGGMWPQSTLADVRAAQALADASDPAATWQLHATSAPDEAPWGAEIFARFIREGLGWEDFASASSFGGYLGNEGTYEGLVFIRCAPGQTNPLSPLYAEAPSEIRECAPTVDELTYETVSFAVTQPERRGPSGIWVVQRWKLLQTKAEPAESLWGIIYPDTFLELQVTQVVPPSDADVTALLQAFLQARVDGQGAEQFLLREPEGSWADDREVPLLYATTGGSAYVRSEIQRVGGPVWPNGLMEYRVQLFAEDETLVEQYFHVIRHDGQLRLVYGYTFDNLPTTENGISVPVPYSLLDGGVTFAVAPPLDPQVSESNYMGFNSERYGRVMIAADPRPGDAQSCEEVPTSADAETLARIITDDSNFETTATVPVRIAGLDGLQMDVTFRTSDSYCYSLWAPDQVPADGSGLFQMRLYLVDYPGESAQVLTVAIIAPEAEFESLLEEATPIVESLEFHTG